MPSFEPLKGLYTLRFNKLRFAYELTDQSIIISTILNPSMFQEQTKMLELSNLMNRDLPDIIEYLFAIIPTRSIKGISEDKTESFITITIPTNNHSDSDNSDNSDSGNSDSDSDRLTIEIIHEMLLNEIDTQFNHFEIRWLGLPEPFIRPNP